MKEGLAPIIAFASGVHLMLVGPPRTGKSSLLRSFASWMRVPSLFLTFHAASTPDLVEGSLHIGALLEGRMVRQTDGTLSDPSIRIAVCDELPRASEAVWDPMLRILERPSPVILATGNWFPKGDRVEALMERIGLWIWWDPPITSPEETASRILEQIALSRSPNPEDRNRAYLSAVFQEPEWERWSPEQILEIHQHAIPSERARQAIGAAAASLYRHVMTVGRGQFAVRRGHFASWIRILTGASILFAGSTDFDEVPQEAREAMVWAWPATDRATLTAWKHLVIDWANPIKGAIIAAWDRVRQLLDRATQDPRSQGDLLMSAARLVRDLRDNLARVHGQDVADRFYRVAFGYVQAAGAGQPYPEEIHDRV